MRKIFTILVLTMASVMSWAASIGAPASIDFGTYNIYGKEEVTDSVELILSPSGISDWGIGVEVIDDAEGIFWTSDAWLYGNGTPDWSGEEHAKVYFYALEEGIFTATLRLTDYQRDKYEDVALSVTVVNNAPVLKTFTRINSTGELKDGDEVVFVSESANAVCGPLLETYLSAITEGVTIADGKITFPEAAQTFIAKKYSGNWQFTTTDTQQRLHLDITGKGAFTYADTQAGAILASWGVSISSGEATISKPDGTFPVEFNSNRFKPYKTVGTGTAVALYKKGNGSQGIEDVESGVEVHKIVRGGQVLILRNGEIYTLTGANVK